MKTETKLPLGLKVTIRNMENQALDTFDANQRASAARIGFVKFTVDTPDGGTIAEVCQNESYAAELSAAAELREALIDALIDARQHGGDISGWYPLAVSALRKAGYDEYGDKCEDTDAKD